MPRILNKAITLEEILCIENSADLIASKIFEEKIPVWSLIRNTFLRTIMSDLLYGEEGGIGGNSNISWAKKIKFVTSSFAHNFSHQFGDSNNEICIMSSGWGNLLIGNRAFDRLCGYFADVFSEKTMILDGGAQWRTYSEFSHKNTVLGLTENFVSPLASRVLVNSSHKKISRDLIQLVIDRARLFLEWECSIEKRNRIENALSRRIAIVPYLVDYYIEFFERKKVRLLLKEDGCFEHSIPAIVAARLSNIRTAEYQHGAIMCGHDAYNFSEVICGSKVYANVLPEYLLSYGVWWHDQTNAPLTMVAIGNPHRETFLRSRSCSLDCNEQVILVLGDGIETAAYLHLCQEIASANFLTRKKVLFRPHPLERVKLDSLSIPSDVGIDRNQNIYDSFKSANVVISELSTGLFEAVGLVPSIFVWKTEKAIFAFSNIPFESFRDLAELKTLFSRQMLCTSTAEKKQIIDTELWEKNWKENYIKFVSGVIEKRG